MHRILELELETLRIRLREDETETLNMHVTETLPRVKTEVSRHIIDIQFHMSISLGQN